MKINNLALAATLLTSEVVANPEAQERQALTEQVVGNQVDALAGKVDVIVAEKEAEAERAEMLEKIRTMVLALTPEQFEDWKQDFEDVGEVELEILEMAAQEYIAALEPAMNEYQEKLEPFKQAVKDSPKGSEGRPAAIAAYKAFIAENKDLKVKHDYFVTTAGNIMVAREEADSASEKAETAKVLATAKQEIAEAAAMLDEVEREEVKTAETEKKRLAAHAKLRATLTATMNQ